MTLEEYFTPPEFDIRRVSLAFNAKLSIDSLTFKEGEVWDNLHAHSQWHPTEADEERFLTSITKRWDENGNEIDGPPLPKRPFFDRNESLATQVLDKAPQWESVNIIRQMLILYAENSDIEIAQLEGDDGPAHSSEETADEELKALELLFMELSIPKGALQQFCKQQLDVHKAHMASFTEAEDI